MFEELRQGYNSVTVVGKLKRNGLQEDVTSNGAKVIRGDMVIESDLGNNEINEIKVNFYSFEGSKPYANLQNALHFTDAATAFDESYITKVRIVGNLGLNEYVHRKSQSVISYNDIRGVFVYESSPESKEGVFGEIDTIITDIVEDRLFGYVVGYKNRIIELKDGITIPEEFKENINKLYQPGDTARLAIQIHNKVIMADTVTFGHMPSGGNIVEDREEYIELIGGMEPYADGDRQKYTNEEIDRVKTLRDQTINELNAQIAPATGGFGGGFSPSNDDIPF